MSEGAREVILVLCTFYRDSARCEASPIVLHLEVRERGQHKFGDLPLTKGGRNWLDYVYSGMPDMTHSHIFLTFA